MDKHCDTTDETAYRERATLLLDEFAQRARAVLRDAGIGIDLIFVVPPSGDVILTFGAAAELYREEWQAIRTTVSSLVRRSIGLESGPVPRCRLRDVSRRRIFVLMASDLI